MTIKIGVSYRESSSYGRLSTMYVIITSFIAVLLVGAVFVYTDSFRFVKTLWLIFSISPYEQEVIGAPKILVFGDSTAYGTGASTNTFSIAGRIGADFPQYTILNMSVNGDTIKDALIRMRELPEQKEYELILLQLGGNDILQKRPISVVKNELEILRNEAQKRATYVVLMTSGNVGGASVFNSKVAKEYEVRTRELRSVSQELFNTQETRYIDLFLEPEEDIIAKDPKRYLAIDGLHPSDEGYGVWYEELKSALSQLLKN